MGQGLQARAVAALVAAIGVGLAAVAVAAPLGWLVKLVPDDGFYYLEIARRIGQGQGSTFDGLHATNAHEVPQPTRPAMGASSTRARDRARGHLTRRTVVAPCASLRALVADRQGAVDDPVIAAPG